MPNQRRVTISAGRDTVVFIAAVVFGSFTEKQETGRERMQFNLTVSTGEPWPFIYFSIAYSSYHQVKYRSSITIDGRIRKAT